MHILPRHMCYFFLPTPPILPFLAVVLLLLSGSFRLPAVLCLVVTAPKKDSSRPAKQAYYTPCRDEQQRHIMTSWHLLSSRGGEQQTAPHSCLQSASKPCSLACSSAIVTQTTARYVIAPSATKCYRIVYITRNINK